MSELFEYIDILYDIYKKEKDINEKKNIIDDILIIYLFIEEIINDNPILNIKYAPKFYKVNDILCHDKKLEYECKKIYTEKINNNYINNEKFKKEDLYFVEYLLDNVVKKYVKILDIPKKYNNEYILNNYICKNEQFYKSFINEKYNYIYDNIPSSNIYVKSLNETLITLKEYNIIWIIHEVMHTYFKEINEKFSETPSILCELGLEKNNELYLFYNRLSDLYNIESDNINDYKYIIGIMLSYTLIDKYGHDFNTLLSICNFIKENEDNSIADIIKLLNINDYDIIDSVNNKIKKI